MQRKTEGRHREGHHIPNEEQIEGLGQAQDQVRSHRRIQQEVRRQTSRLILLKKKTKNSGLAYYSNKQNKTKKLKIT